MLGKNGMTFTSSASAEAETTKAESIAAIR
jgi:hypothetical protein